MKLVSVRIRNFKSIEDSGEFTVGDLTCLAGKNESGKTAILQALYRLNPVETTETEYVPLDEYPRQRYSQFTAGEQPTEVLETTWRLDRSETLDIEERLGKGCLRSNTLRISAGYQNNRVWEVDLDEPKVVD